MDARLLVRVHVPEIVIVCSFHDRVLVSWIVEIAIIEKKQLGFIDREVSRHIFVLEGTGDFVKHS